MEKIQSKLMVYGGGAVLCVLLLGGLLSWGAYREYADLRSFQQTTEVSLQAYDLARKLTHERQMAYQASAFLGEGTPLEMIGRFREASEASRAALRSLVELGDSARAGATPTFNRAFEAAVASEAPLGQMRAELLDERRVGQDRDAGEKLKTRALRAYDLALFAQANFLPVLALETGEAELVRRIQNQDTLARLQRDFWKVKGLLGTVLRDSRLTDTAVGELKTKRLAMDDHLSRLDRLADPALAAALAELYANADYKMIVGGADEVLALGAKTTDFSRFGTHAAYQAGPFRRIEAEFARLAEVSNAGIRDFTARHLGEARTRLLWLLAVSGAMVALMVAFGALIARSITRPLVLLSQALGEVARNGLNSSRQITDSSKVLSDDACTEAASLEEISASVEELTGMTRANLQTVHDMSALSTQAVSSAAEGGNRIRELGQAMAGIERTNNDIATILKTIDEIAFQTNILALNAAVEAARAGEAGAGFAVVADEVRTLAQRSAAAARETREKIESALRSNSQGTLITRKVEERFEEISSAIRRYNEAVGSVEAASSQSSDGLRQVRDAISQLDQITQRTAAAAEENAAASAEMAQQVEQISHSLEALERMVSRRR